MNVPSMVGPIPAQQRGLHWPGLLPLLFQSSSGLLPHVLIIHLSSNDLGLVKGKALVWHVKDYFRTIWAQRLQGAIVWSAVIPHLKWWRAQDPVNIDRAHYKGNREVKKALGIGKGHYIPHLDILWKQQDPFRSDGVHLSDKGNGIFLGDLQ